MLYSIIFAKKIHAHDLFTVSRTAKQKKSSLMLGFMPDDWSIKSESQNEQKSKKEIKTLFWWFQHCVLRHIKVQEKIVFHWMYN